jgi:hypothetical protein
MWWHMIKVLKWNQIYHSGLGDVAVEMQLKSVRTMLTAGAAAGRFVPIALRLPPRPPW